MVTPEQAHRWCHRYGGIAPAARALGISPTTFHRLFKPEYNRRTREREREQRRARLLLDPKWRERWLKYKREWVRRDRAAAPEKYRARERAQYWGLTNAQLRTKLHKHDIARRKRRINAIEQQLQEEVDVGTV